MNGDHIVSWALFESGFLIICRMHFLEKRQLANEFSASNCDVNCDGNALLSAKKGLKTSLFF